MGVLDDAIREHLELKRQHGASEEEISQAEADALGPARREPALAPEAVEEQAAELAEAPEPLPPPGAAADETQLLPPDALPAPEELPPPEEVPPPPEGALPEADLAPPPAVYDEIEQTEPDPLEHPAPPQPAPGPAQEDPLAPPDSAPSRPHGDPAFADSEFEPDEVPADEALGGDTATHEAAPREAPLPPHDPEPDGAPSPALPPEETPDFREEKSEHDRLWFERKPPGDPDFDE